MNPIDYLVGKGFRVTSDPTRYSSGVWGKRDYTVDGYNYDAYCGGYHRAYDLAKSHLAPIPAVCGGVVAAGTARHGNFGGTVVVANRALGIQVIYGHLDRNLKVRIGQNIRQGDIVGLQSNTNYSNVTMASHLHIQFQNYGYVAGERAFVCSGIDPLKINIPEDDGPETWLWRGYFTADSRIRIRDHPSKQAPARGIVTPGRKVRFDRLHVNEGLWWIRMTGDGGQKCIAVGEKQTGVNFRRADALDRLWGKVSGLDTSRGKAKKG
ncbi:M23 family metallopeptidase [Salinicoccus roseus]|uniref:M23 family metallopeptidase n=1 Tax=Salinicoccus roseus TaxID=45670 RepID=UPI0015C93DF9|nr:M23 family metallopeptidase [Salinicoccus roseus]